MSQAIQFRKGMAVKRYHTVNLVIDETVGHHSCNVAHLVILICESMRIEPSVNLLKTALMHDVAEQWTGDIPATAKWESEEFAGALESMENYMALKNELVIPTITEYEYAILKQADMLDLVLKMQEEIGMGNFDCIGVMNRGFEAIMKNNPCSFVKEILNVTE